MDHVKLSNDAKSQMFYPIIWVSHPILNDLTRSVCNNAFEFKKIFKLKWNGWINLHFIQINLVDFNNCNIITHKNNHGLANFIKILKDFNISKIHAKPKIVSTSHRFTKLVLVASTDPLWVVILTIKVLSSFPTHFKGVNIVIQLIVFKFQKNFRPFVSTILASFLDSKWHFRELEKYPWNDWKRSSNLEIINMEDKLCNSRFVLCIIQWISMKMGICWVMIKAIILDLTPWNVETPSTPKHIRCSKICLSIKPPYVTRTTKFIFFMLATISPSTKC